MLCLLLISTYFWFILSVIESQETCLKTWLTVWLLKIWKRPCVTWKIGAKNLCTFSIKSFFNHKSHSLCFLDTLCWLLTENRVKNNDKKFNILKGRYDYEMYPTPYMDFCISVLKLYVHYHTNYMHALLFFYYTT